MSIEIVRVVKFGTYFKQKTERICYELDVCEEKKGVKCKISLWFLIECL